MVRLEQSFLTEPEAQVLRTLGKVGPGLALQLPEGKLADTAAELVGMGLVEEVWGFYALTDAGRSRLRSNTAHAPDNGAKP